MPTRRTFFSLLALLFVVIFSRCSFRPFAPELTVTVKINPAATGHLARGPELSAMDCFGVIVRGAPNAVGASDIGGRVPACMAMSGAFFGPYTYAEITGTQAQKAKFPLSSGAYDFSVLGFKTTSGCGGGLSGLFQSSVPAETYVVTQPARKDLTASSTVSLDGTVYSAVAATNRTPYCTPSAFSCDSTLLCDRFTDADDITLSGHSMDVGSGWITISSFLSPTIIQNSMRATPGFESPSRAFAVAEASSNTISVRGKVTMTSALVFNAGGVIARYNDPSNYIFAHVHRSDAQALCEFRVYQRVGGTDAITFSSAMAYPDDCPENTPLDILLTVSGNSFYASYLGYSLQDLIDGALATGTKAGFATEYQGAGATFFFDDFSVVTYH